MDKEVQDTGGPVPSPLQNAATKLFNLNLIVVEKRTKILTLLELVDELYQKINKLRVDIDEVNNQIRGVDEASLTDNKERGQEDVGKCWQREGDTQMPS